MVVSPVGASTRHSSRYAPWYLLTGCLLYRALVMVAIRTLPPMEPGYIQTARWLFSSSSASGTYLAPGYSTLLYLFHLPLHNWLVASGTLYVLFSTAAAWFCYLVARDLFGQRVGMYNLAIVTVLPGLTSGVAGFSHTPVVAACFLNAAVYAFARLIFKPPSLLAGALCGISLLLATLTRPDYVLYFMALIAFATWLRNRRLLKDYLVPIAVMSAVLLAGVYLQRTAMRHRGQTEFGLLGNKRYSYLTYMCGIAQRLTGSIPADDGEVLRLAAATFGPAEANHWSVVRAALTNPRESTKNLVFNGAELVKLAGHSLVFPFFLYPLVGIGLLQTWQQKCGGHLLLATLILPCVISNLAFHVEPRLLLPLLLPLSIWAACGLNAVDRQYGRLAVAATLISLSFLSVAYVSHMRHVRQLEFAPGSKSILAE